MRYVFALVVLAGLAWAMGGLGAPGTLQAGEACEDPTPDGGGELEFKGIGTPEHLVTRAGDLCRDGSDTWTFETVAIDLEQFVAIRVVETAGDVTVMVQPSPGEAFALATGETFRTSHGAQQVQYEIVVTGASDEAASYLVQACRSINEPCPLLDEVTPKPGDVSCDGTVDSRDALLILQFAAGLLAMLPCQNVAHANLDGDINSLDALLILQLNAGLIDRLALP